MFLADSEIKSTLAAYLKTTPDQLQPYFDQIVADAHQWAYNEILAVLQGRAFSIGQVQGWDRGGEYEKALAIWWALTKGGVTHDYDDKFLKNLDRRAELHTAQILNSQQFQGAAGSIGRPASETNLGTSGRVGFGVQDTTKDTFTMGGMRPPFLSTPGRTTW